MAKIGNIDIHLLMELWKKPYGKPVVIIIGLFIAFLIFDFTFLSGRSIHYNSHRINTPVVFEVDTTDVKYRVSMFIGNKKSRHRLRYELIDPDEDTIVDQEDSYARNKRSFAFTPEQTGTYELWIESVQTFFCTAQGS